MNFGDQLKRIRRYLRDPDGNIWSRAILLNLYNDIQRDIQMKTRYLEDVRTLRVVPQYHCAYLHDWEWTYLPSSESQFYQALRYHQQGDFTFCHRWEGQIDHAGDASDEGAHFTQPFEAFMGLEPGEPVKVRFPSNYHTTKLMAYDREPIEAASKKAITQRDTSYISRSGTPFAYYREDTLDNSFIPYPRPSTVAWDDIVETAADPDFLYSHDWEYAYLSGNGEQFTDNDSDEERDYIFTWETGTFSGQDEPARGMWLFEGAFSPGGSVVYVSGDTTESGFGIITGRTGSLFSEETGLLVDVVEADDNLLLIYEVMPTDIASDNDESDWPEFLQKYIEHGVLARAYRVNSDGKIKSLSEYWDYRYSVGLEAIKRFMSKAKEDRDYRLSTRTTPTHRSRRLPRLPSGYPAV